MFVWYYLKKMVLNSYVLNFLNISQLNTVKLFFCMLFYNEFCNFDYVLDICMAPLYHFVDNYVSFLGPAFVLTCGFVMFLVIVVSYWIGLPYWWNKSPMFTILLLVTGNWLLVNAAFHFFMGIKCKPGHPGQVLSTHYSKDNVHNAVSLCKKCIAPKPQRTHHCSVCKNCILLMDHHCPWLNNCVGHYNRRYFFLYMVYIVVGVIFLMIFGLEIFYKEIWLYEFPTDVSLDGCTIPENFSEQKFNHPYNNSTWSAVTSEYSFRRQCILFTALMCAGTFVALGLLLLRHIRLISNGETTIEMHINQTQTERYKKKNKVYINPYNYGIRRNWTLMLGIYNGSGRTWRHILLPSTHKPFGNGFVWPRTDFDKTEWSRFFRDDNY